VSQPDNYGKCLCIHCGGRIEFPGESAGTTVLCPHCNQSTVLAAAAANATVPTVVIAPAGNRVFQVFLVAALVVLAAGGGIVWYLRTGDRAPAPPPAVVVEPVQTGSLPPGSPTSAVVAPVVPPDPWHGLKPGPISLQKASNGHLIYAVGNLRNTSDHQRFGVKVELDVLDADNEKIGTATDYTPSIDPGKEWKFRALVIDRAAARAKLADVKEN